MASLGLSVPTAIMLRRRDAATSASPRRRAIRRELRRGVDPIECFAIGRYALAVRMAAAQRLETEGSRAARERLRAYGDARIAQCAAHDGEPATPPAVRRNGASSPR
jgi:hypothetical protein